MDKSLAAAAGTRSLSSVLLHVLARAVSEAPAAVELCPPCLEVPADFGSKTLAIGIFIGFCLGPILEGLSWLQLAWRRAIFR